MVTLRTSDGKDFLVEQNAAEQSITIKSLIDDCGIDDPILLPNVTCAILPKVIEYCKKHTELVNEEHLKEWDANFTTMGENMDLDTLHDLLLAANFLNIKGLLDLACSTVADIIKGKTPEEIRRIFSIKNDFTQEEEEEIRKENQWALSD